MDSAHSTRTVAAPSTPQSQRGSRRDSLGPIESSHLEVDYFQGLLVRSGVPPSALPKRGRTLTPDDAARLLSWLLKAEVPLRDFGPWRMASHLLWEVLRGGTPVPRSELYARMRRFQELLVLRTDGFLVRATTGRAVQQVGEVHLDEDALHAEGFRVGPFYMPRGGFLYPVDDSLEIHPDAVLAGVYAPEEDTLGPAVEGAGMAIEDSLSGIVKLVLHPDEALEGLAQLPSAVRVLIQNAPEYWEHFQASSHGARVRSVSRILTHVLITCGTAGAGTAGTASLGGRLGSLGVPVLSLSSEGTLVLRMVAVPAGQAVTVVGTGLSAVYVLHVAGAGAGAAGGGGSGSKGSSGPPPAGGPGGWVQKAEGMSESARRYQVQVTGTPPGWIYRVFFGPGPEDYVDFDGFINGVLLEAKGPNLAKFLGNDLKPLSFFEGEPQILAQANRQFRAARGLSIRWLVAEKKFADYLRTLFENNNLESIEILHVPAKP